MIKENLERFIKIYSKRKKKKKGNNRVEIRSKRIQDEYDPAVCRSGRGDVEAFCRGKEERVELVKVVQLFKKKTKKFDSPN